MTAQTATAAENSRLLTDFNDPAADFRWRIVNDDVMGGRSEGDFEIREGTLHFAGRTNTRGGGFSSVRTGTLDLDLSGFDGIRLELRGDGRRYSWQIRTDARFRGREVSFWSEFDTVEGEQITVELPFKDFDPRFRGTRLGGGPPDPARIEGMGLMINDGRDGVFDIRVEQIAAYRTVSPLSLENLRWTQRILVISAEDESDARVQQQREAIADSRAAFEDRDMLLLTLFDVGDSAAGERRLTEAEIASARQALGIDTGSFRVLLVGKDGGIKLTRDTVVAPDEIYALIDTMPMRRQEMRERQ